MNTGPKPRRFRRLGIVLALIGLGLALAWRMTTLSALPNVGDPFDIDAFINVSVPDDQNAFVLYRQAKALLVRTPPGAPENWALSSNPAGAKHWEGPWLAANRAALDLWRRGTERPESLYHSPRTVNAALMLPVIQDLRDFGRLAILEGERLEAEGHFGEALGWYLAVARSGNHCGHHGIVIERLVGLALRSIAFHRLTRWAANPRVDALMLRRAIAEIEASGKLAPTNSEILKTEYLSLRNSFDDPDLMDLKWQTNDLPRMYQWKAGRAILEDLPRLAKREPERSRRVIRLIFTNWLAYCDRPLDQRPPFVARAKGKWGQLLHNGNADLRAELFVADASAPAGARALSPDELASWWKSTLYARRSLTSFGTLDQTVNRERKQRAALLIALANEACQREHGQTPDRVDALVGPYLKTLPEGYAPTDPPPPPGAPKL